MTEDAMAGHMCRLILSDMENTILPKGDKTVSERTHAAFHAALDAGIKIGPSSGRALSWVPPMFGGDEDCCRTAVATNGLEVYLDGECIHHEYFDHATLEGLRSKLADHPGAGLVCFVGYKPYVVAGSREELSKWFPAYAEEAEVVSELPQEKITKTNVFQDLTRPETQELVDELNDEVEGLDFDLAMAGFLNVMPAGWNKGTGIKVLCEAIGCTTDDVVVFGDANNDLAMFDVVANSVAVANATEEAAAAARWHIGACRDDAVAAAIEELAAGVWPFTE